MEGLVPGEDPERIGPYLLKARLGAGGMGRVYLGESAGRRKVAVKVMRAELVAKDPAFRDRFRREVQAASAVGGHYTAHIVTSDADANPPWFASAYINAPSLADVVARSGTPLDLAAATSLGAGLAEALIAVHSAELVHRDLKPSNVLMADDGPRVIDFGIVRIMENGTPLTATPAGTFMGTVGYLSPEQVRGHQVGWESDVFSLGALLVYATTGRTPFGGGSIETVLYRTLHEEPDLAGVPAELRPVVRGCLDKQPGRRPTVRTLLKHFGELAAVADRRGAARNSTPRRTLVDPARAANPPVSKPSSAPAWVAALIVGALTYGQVWLLSTMWWQPAALIAVVVTLLAVVVFRAARSASWSTEEDIGVLVCCLLALACGVVALVELFKTNLLWWAVVLIAIGVVLVLSLVTHLVIDASTMDSCAGSVTTAGFASCCLAAALMGWSTEITPWLSLPLAFVIAIATAKVLKPVLSSGLRRQAPVGGDES